MNKVKKICLTLLLLTKQVCLLPQTVTTAIKQRKRQAVFDENETERLDRIRNPSKYEGK